MHALCNTAPWRDGWLLHPEPALPEAGSRCRPGFRLLALPGEVALNQPGAGWRLIANWCNEVEDLQAGCLAHGFFLASGGESIIGYVVAPTVLCGCAPHDARVRLVDASLETGGDAQQTWIEGAGHAVALVQEEHQGLTRWALAWTDTSLHDALVQARAALQQDAAAMWQGLLSRRQELWTETALAQANDVTLLAAAELLLGTVRPADSVFPGRWLDTQDQPPGMAIGPAALALPALARIDRACALEVCETILHVTAEDRDLHALVSHDPAAEMAVPPWPLLAQTASMLASGQTDHGFAGRVAPRLIKLLERQLGQLARGDGMLAWPSAAGSLLPDIHDDAVISADVTALMASEIDALVSLCDPFPDLQPALQTLAGWRSRAADLLRTQFWDEPSGSFRGRMPDGQPIRRASAADALPLSCRDISAKCRDGALRLIAPGGALWTDRGLYDWARWPNDPDDPPNSAHIQILALRLLRTHAPHQAADALARVLAGRELAVETDGETCPVLEAALLIEAHAGSAPQPDVIRPRIALLDRLDRHRRAILIGGCLLAGGLFGTMAVPQLFRSDPTESVLEVQLGTAEMRYSEQDYRGALALFEELRSTPLRDQRAIDARIGDCWYRLADWTRAEQTYRAALERNPDQPKVWLNHALSLFRLEKFDEAAVRYREFIRVFGALYPDLKSRAETALTLCEEQAARRR